MRKALEKEPDRRYQTMGELRADLEQALSLVDGGRRKASSSLIQMPKVQPPKPAPARVSINQSPNSSMTGNRISQTKVTPAVMAPRVSQTRVPGARPTSPNMSQPRLSSMAREDSSVKSFVATIMPNFARVCIVLAIVAVIALASQIIGDYVKTNPSWSKYWHSEPDYQTPQEPAAGIKIRLFQAYQKSDLISSSDYRLRR